MRTVRIDAGAVSDHMVRLYENEPDDDGWYHHLETSARRIRIIERGKARAIESSKATDKVEITDEAVVEFLDDMDYQIEFDEGEYRAQCRRAVRQLRLDS